MMRWLWRALCVAVTALLLGCSHGGDTYLGAGGSSGSAGASGSGSGGRGGQGGRASGGSSAGTESSGGNGAGGTAGTLGSGGSEASGGSDASGGSAGTESSGGNGGGGAAGNGGTVGQGGGCSGDLEEKVGELCVAKMAQVTATGLGGNVTYSIDVTEVTRGQYEGWLATDPATYPTGNYDCQMYDLDGYVPDAACMTSAYQGPNADHHPIVCVDWCDAEAYCAAVGKQLCGALLGGPSPYMGDEFHISRWLHACANDGNTSFPYEGQLQPTSCNGPGYGAGTTVAVGSLSTCQSSRVGFSGIYDMSGNVSEWENSCYGGGSFDCKTRGGAFDTEGLHCGLPRGYASVSATPDIGFRCCSL